MSATWSGVVLDVPPASGSAVVRSYTEARATIAAARPWGRIRPSRGPVPNPKGEERRRGAFAASTRCAVSVHT